MSAAQKKTKPGPPPQYGRRVLVGGHFHPKVQTQLRHLAEQHKTTIQALLTEALDNLFTHYGKPRIAGVMPQPER